MTQVIPFRPLKSEEAVELATRYGFTVERHGTHYVLKRGQKTFTLNSSGTNSAWVSQQLIKYCSQIALTAARGRHQTSGTPVAIRYEGELYAVVSDFGHYWRIQSLADGKVHMVLKQDCEEVREEDLKPTYEEVQTAGEIKEEQVEDLEETPVLAQRPLGLNNATDREAWMRLTHRYIETLDVQIEQLEGHLRQARNQRQVLQQTVDAMSGKAVASVAKQDVRRRRWQRTPTETEERIREWIRQGRPTPIKTIAAETGLGISTVYRIIKEENGYG